MADNNLLRFPRGQIAISGDLRQATDAEFTFTNGAVLRHTLRSTDGPAGFTQGNKEVSGSVNTIISEDGIERDYLDFAKTLEGKRFQFKTPLSTYVIEGVVQSVTIRLVQDNAVEANVTLIGTLVD